MPKLFSNVDRIYIKGNGYTPVEMSGDGYGQILAEGAKLIGKNIIPFTKKVWGSLTPETQENLIEAGVDFAGKQVTHLGKKAQGILKKLLTDEKESGQISKKAENMLRNLVKEGKKKAKTKAKAELIPKATIKELKPAKKKTIEKHSQEKLMTLLANA